MAQKKAEKAVHLETTRLNWACRDWYYLDDRASKHFRLVTCGNCKRTKAYRKAVKGQ